MRKYSRVASVLLTVAVICVGQGLAARGEPGRTGTYYVSTKGDDTADGKSKKTTFRTIAHAAKVAQAGDTVLVSPGDYGDERIVFANSGKKGQPIVFKGHGGRPVLKSDDDRAKAFLAKGKAYIHIEGFDIFGYDEAIQIRDGSSYCLVRDFRCFGRGGSIKLTYGVHHCWVDSCYIEDTYRNSIQILGSLPHGKPPCPLNTVTNCTVVRGGHGSIDIHTVNPDTYVVGCIVRERGKERDGRMGNGSLYVHNAPMPRTRVVGNAVTECFGGIVQVGVFDGLVAENLVYNTIWGITNERSSEDHGIVLKDESKFLFAGRNSITDNICFDIGKRPAYQLYGSRDNHLARNYADGKSISGDADYDCQRYRGADATGNVLADTMKGNEKILVRKGSYALRYSLGLWPAGTIFRLTDKKGKTVEKTIGLDGANFGTLASGTYALQTILPGKALPAPQYLRVAALPAAEGGAVIVWADCCIDETGFVLERKLPGEKNFKEIAELKADVTRHIDKKVGRKKAIYRVRAVRGNEKSAWSNTDEVVRYGYWFTNRTGLAVDGYTAFGQVEAGQLKTLIVEKAKRVARKADAAEGLSSFALLEAGKPGTAWPKSAGAKGKAEVWLVASKPVTATLRWRAGWIRGFVEGEGEYSLELTTAGRAVKSATFNGKTVKTVYNKDKGLVRLDLSGNGALAVELINE